MTTPTFATVSAAYLENASYRELADVASARLFVTACTQLMLLLPSSAGKGDANTQFNTSLILAERNAAIQFIAANAPVNGGVKHLSFEDFRR